MFHLDIKKKFRVFGINTCFENIFIIQEAC